MGKAAAKKNDRITGNDIHIEMVPAGAATVPTPTPHPFQGILDGDLSDNVQIDGAAAATVGSMATNTPSHIPKAGPFETPPKNKGKIQMGSFTVQINGKGAARHGDMCLTCCDPSDMPVGQVQVAMSTVYIGD